MNHAELLDVEATRRLADQALEVMAKPVKKRRAPRPAVGNLLVDKGLIHDHRRWGRSPG